MIYTFLLIRCTFIEVQKFSAVAFREHLKYLDKKSIVGISRQSSPYMANTCLLETSKVNSGQVATPYKISWCHLYRRNNSWSKCVFVSIFGTRFPLKPSQVKNRLGKGN